MTDRATFDRFVDEIRKATANSRLVVHPDDVDRVRAALTLFASIAAPFPVPEVIVSDHVPAGRVAITRNVDAGTFIADINRTVSAILRPLHVMPPADDPPPSTLGESPPLDPLTFLAD